MKSLSWCFAPLPLVYGHAIGSSASKSCSAYNPSIDLSQYNAQINNKTYYSAETYNATNVFNTIPFCELVVAVSYGLMGNDTLNFLLWLPDKTEYANRFMAVGDGGMAGVIDTLNMVTQLNSGYGFAVAGGDAGHSAATNNDGGGAPGVYLPYLHDPAQVEAWIHDAISLFTPTARALVEDFYGSGGAPKYSYYDGCSTGGAQGFSLAQFHPHLYDGIYAGSPGNWYSHLALSFLWNAQQTNSSARNLTQQILNFTTAAVLTACDSLDGVSDGVLENPLKCHFAIDTLACSPKQNPSSPNGTIHCLTPPQISTFKAIYSGPVKSKTDESLYPGFSPGSEIQWLYQEGLLADAFSIPILQNLVYDNLSYDSNTFNWASDVRDVNQKAGKYIDAISPDLSSFKSSGGKMLVTQGWADPLNAALWPIEHLQQIQSAMGGEGAVREFFQLFMVPGGGHCGAASFYPQVPAVYEVVPALVEWVEKGVVPAAVKSTTPPDGSDRTHRLCPWPKTAVYKGNTKGRWKSYVCQ